MKINWFNFLKKKQQQNITIQIFSSRLMVFNYVADARELKLRHLIFLSPPLVKMNIFPHFVVTSHLEKGIFLGQQLAEMDTSG